MSARKKRATRAREWWDVSGQQLAQLCSCDLRTIQNCVGEGMPQINRNRYDSRAAVPWHRERAIEQARAGKGLNDLDLARQRKTVAEARLAEIELAKAEESVVPVDVAAHELRTRLETVAGAVKAIHKFQPDIKAAVSDEAADALCDRMADEILAELYGLSDTIPD